MTTARESRRSDADADVRRRRSEAPRHGRGRLHRLAPRGPPPRPRRPGRRSRRLQRLLRSGRRSARNVAPHRGHPRYRLVEGDIRDRALVFRLFAEEGFDAVVHLAARAGVRPSLAEPVLYEEVNCVGDLAPARGGRGARQAAVRLRFLVLGLRHQFEAPVLRGRPDRPADLALRDDQARRRAPGLQRATTSTASRAICLRFFTVYGPRQRPEMAIARFIRCDRRRARRSPSTATAPRGATTPTSTTSSTASRRRSTSSAAGFEIVNLGGAHPVTLAELVAAIERATGKTARLERQPDQPGDVPVTFAAVAKAERLLGFRARVRSTRGSAGRWRGETRIAVTPGTRDGAHEHLHGRDGLRRPRHGRRASPTSA